ncbi:hypothetical protein JST97_06105 [bacterium]|nr:hypothetical protein [bacterium]
MKIAPKEPRVILDRRPVLDQGWTPVSGSDLAYQKDSHDLIFRGRMIEQKNFGVVRQHALDEKGQLWLQSDRYFARLTAEGLEILAQSRGMESFRGLLIRPDGVWCGQGSSLQHWSREGKQLQNFPLGYRVAQLKEIGDQIVVQGDMLQRRLSVFDGKSAVAEGHEVVLDSVRKHPHGGLAWLERGQLARWNQGQLVRHPVSPRADGWMARQDGGTLIKASEKGGSQLLHYSGQGKLKSRFDFGKDTYLRDLLVDESSPWAVVRLEVYQPGATTRQIVEKLDLTSKGDLAWFGSWNRQRLATSSGATLHPLVDTQGQVLLTDGRQIFQSDPQKPLDPEQIQAIQIGMPRQSLDFSMTPAAGTELAQFYRPESRLPGMQRTLFEDGRVSASTFMHQPKQGPLQVRCPGLYQKFVLAHSFPGPLGATLAAVTDQGKLVMSLPALGLREYELGSSPQSIEAHADGFRLQLADGRQAEVELEAPASSC